MEQRQLSPIGRGVCIGLMLISPSELQIAGV